MLRVDDPGYRIVPIPLVFHLNPHHPYKSTVDKIPPDPSDGIFLAHLSQFHISDDLMEWAKLALKNSHGDESERVKNETKRLQLLYTKNENIIHQLYEDKLEGIITKDFFKVQFDKFQIRQLKIEEGIRKLRCKNVDYINQGVQLLELIQNASEVT